MVKYKYGALLSFSVGAVAVGEGETNSHGTIQKLRGKIGRGEEWRGIEYPRKNSGYAHLFLKQMLKSFSHLKIDFSMICGIYWDDSFFAMHFFRGQNVLNFFLCEITQSRQED